MRPELPTAVAVDNSASIQPARSIFISWGKSVQISGATSDDSQLDSTIKHFTKKLTNAVYGNHSKHKNKQHWARPLVIAAVEGKGKNNHKRTHLHLAIGNIPSTHLGNFAHHAQAAFARCDFAHKHMCVKPVHDSFGWLGYITKEVGYSNWDALDVVSSCIPTYIQQRICT